MGRPLNHASARAAGRAGIRAGRGDGNSRASLLAAVLSFLLAGCLVQDGSQAGRGSEVENEVYGVMVDASGHAVAGARVSAYPAAAASAPASPVDSAVTDAEGRYSLDALVAGVYNVVGDSGDGRLVVLVPDVRYAPGPGIDLGTDTLLAPGGIEGRIRQGGSGKAGVMAYVPGMSYLSITDAEGTFLLSGIPKGIHRVHYQSAGFSAAPDSGVVVEPGRITRLPDKELAVDTAVPPPAPARLEAEFDTLAGVVRLRWSAVPVADLLGYKVYRDANPLSLPVAVSGIILDTVFADTLREAFGVREPAPDIGYRIRTVDRERNEGTGFSPAARLTAAPASQVITRLVLFVNDVTWFDRVLPGRPLRGRIEFTNATRLIRKVEWLRDGVPVRTIDPAAAQGRDSLAFAWADTGFHRLEVRVTDEGGDMRTAVAAIRIVADLPFAFAGADTTVSIGDKVTLHAHGFDEMGTVARLEWDPGAAGRFREVPPGDFEIQAPDTPAAVFPCILRVTDDDGNTALDTVNVRVLADPPVAVISALPREAFVDETISLSGLGSLDGFGRIVAWEWSVGNAGTFAKSADGMASVTGPGPDGGTIRCLLRVADDDGQMDTAEISVSFRPRNRWTSWSLDAPAQSIQGFAACEFGDKLWLLETHPYGNDLSRWNLWRTADMRTWEKVKPSGLQVDPDKNFQAVVHAGGIWLHGTTDSGMSYSRDGVAWKRVPHPPEFGGLESRTLVAHADRLWMLGTRGFNRSTRIEVWRTEDGDAWTCVTDSAGHGLLAIRDIFSWNDRIWAYGSNMTLDSGVEADDLWSSADGRSWRREATSVLVDPDRYVSANMLVFEGRLWMVSLRESRHTTDGIAWSDAGVEAPVFPSSGVPRALTFRNRLWLLSPSQSQVRGSHWEIWRGPW